MVHHGTQRRETTEHTEHTEKRPGKKTIRWSILAPRPLIPFALPVFTISRSLHLVFFSVYSVCSVVSSLLSWWWWSEARQQIDGIVNVQTLRGAGVGQGGAVGADFLVSEGSIVLPAQHKVVAGIQPRRHGGREARPLDHVMHVPEPFAARPAPGYEFRGQVQQGARLVAQQGGAVHLADGLVDGPQVTRGQQRGIHQNGRYGMLREQMMDDLQVGG